MKNPLFAALKQIHSIYFMKEHAGKDTRRGIQEPVQDHQQLQQLLVIQQPEEGQQQGQQEQQRDQQKPQYDIIQPSHGQQEQSGRQQQWQHTPQQKQKQFEASAQEGLEDEVFLPNEGILSSFEIFVLLNYIDLIYPTVLHILVKWNRND